MESLSNLDQAAALWQISLFLNVRRGLRIGAIRKPKRLPDRIVASGEAVMKIPYKNLKSVLLLIGGVLTLLLAYRAILPSIDYSKLVLIQPLSPGGLLLLDGRIKNYGQTAAGNYSVQIILIKGPATEKIPEPDFDMGVDSKGQNPAKEYFDLGPNQEHSFLPKPPRYWVVDPGAYDEIMSGKMKLFWFTNIEYQDLLFIPHTKLLCHTYIPNFLNPRSLARCPTE